MTRALRPCRAGRAAGRYKFTVGRLAKPCYDHLAPGYARGVYITTPVHQEQHLANITPIAYFADQATAAGAIATGWVAGGVILQGRPIRRSKWFSEKRQR
jgi:hypothetical protein